MSYVPKTVPKTGPQPQTDTESAAAADEDLVRACAAGDRRAFEVLVSRHQRQVYRLCYRFVGNHEDASELAQDAFVRAFRAIGRFEGHAKFTTWLHRISVNVCLNRLASKRPPHDSLTGIDRATAASEGADATVLRAERAGRVRAAIARLPKKQRAALILRAYHDLPHDEIARILDSSVGAVKANFFHALGSLRRMLKDE